MFVGFASLLCVYICMYIVCLAWVGVDIGALAEFPEHSRRVPDRDAGKTGRSVAKRRAVEVVVCTTPAAKPTYVPYRRCIMVSQQLNVS